MFMCGFSSESAFVPQEVTANEMENAREELSQLPLSVSPQQAKLPQTLKVTT